MLRPVFYRAHKWVGLLAGVYLAFIGVTGAVVVFRQELQSAAYPEFHRPQRANAPNAEATTVLRELAAAYPGYRVSGLDWPTHRRDTFLAYVNRDGEFRTVFAHPVSGRISGELPYDWIRRLQDLHFDLLGGSTGRTINGVGAICLLVMGVTGLIVWWRGRVPASAKRFAASVHHIAGASSAVLLLMWGTTGAYYAFPQSLRSAVNAVTPLTIVSQPQSTGSPDSGAAPTPPSLIGRARAAVPGAQLARLVWPFGERGTFVVVMAREVHGDYDSSDEVTLYFDRYSGALLLARDHRERTAGDVMTAWIGPLHFGTFGGLPVKVVWAAAGLCLPLLAVTGVQIWWRRRAISVPGRSRQPGATR